MRSLLLTGLGVLFAFTTVACGGDDADTDAGSTVRRDAGAPGTDAGSIEDAGAALEDAGMAEMDAGPAPRCGEGGDGTVCEATEFCDYALQCRGTDLNPGGECASRPEACADVCAPVCGCDGVTYRSECEAHRAGVDSASTGPCGGSCEPIDATASGNSSCQWGHKWDGTSCVLVRGCNGCVGTDCDTLMTFEECEMRAASCARAACD